MMDFDKFEIEMMARAMKKLVDGMRASQFIGDDDPHLLKCDALHAKLELLRKGKPEVAK